VWWQYSLSYKYKIRLKSFARAKLMKNKTTNIDSDLMTESFFSFTTDVQDNQAIVVVMWSLLQILDEY
jgi:hypothetical protein